MSSYVYASFKSHNRRYKTRSCSATTRMLGLFFRFRALSYTYTNMIVRLSMLRCCICIPTIQCNDATMIDLSDITRMHFGKAFTTTTPLQLSSLVWFQLPLGAQQFVLKKKKLSMYAVLSECTNVYSQCQETNKCCHRINIKTRS